VTQETIVLPAAGSTFDLLLLLSRALAASAVAAGLISKRGGILRLLQVMGSDAGVVASGR
jgi:hypothetical protein